MAVWLKLLWTIASLASRVFEVERNQLATEQRLESLGRNVTIVKEEVENVGYRQHGIVPSDNVIGARPSKADTVPEEDDLKNLKEELFSGHKSLR